MRESVASDQLEHGIVLVPQTQTDRTYILFHAVHFCILLQQSTLLIARFEAMHNTLVFLHDFGSRNSMIAQISPADYSILCLFSEMNKQFRRLWFENVVRRIVF